MKLLGLRLCTHDSNISYFDGTNLHYYKSERKHGIKHHAYNNLWQWQKEIKDLWNVDYNEIDEIAIIIDSQVHKLPLDNEDFFPAVDYNYLPVRNKVVRVNHHYAHALSCFPVTTKTPKVDIVIDGYGDYNISWTVFKDRKLIKKGLITEVGSIGKCMNIAGAYLGVQSEHDDDYAGKVMGLQSYGTINNDFLKHLEQFDMNSINRIFDIEEWFNFHGDALVGNLKPLDWIKTVHQRIDNLLVSFFSEYANDDDVISYSGGVAQNVIWNTSLKNKFKNLVIPPHCADEGLSLGAVEYLRIKNKLKPFKLNNFPYCQTDERPDGFVEDTVIEKVAQYLQEGKIVAWYQGNGEIGPRALGHRSLLMNPTIPDAKLKVNKIKKREVYRPFGCSILEKHQKEYFGTDIHNPHMLYVGNTTKDNLKSITHIDGTCRFQSVTPTDGPFYKLLKSFYDITNCPVLLNTSFNINGKPILGNTTDTKSFYENSDIDVLVIGNKILTK